MTKSLEIKKLRNSYYKRIKNQALSLETELSQELKAYQKQHETLANREFTLSSTSQLIKKATESKFIYIGDFHTFEQSQKNSLRLIKLLIKKKLNFCLGLEMVSTSNQHFINAYLNHQLTEREFLEAIDYYETWCFPWSHYKDFFQLAITHGFPILALNSEGSLSQRDEHAAVTLYKHSKSFPSLSYINIIGELHVLPKNLPLELERLYPDDEAPSKLILHQNLDQVFWKLYDKPTQEDHIVRFNESEFSINSSPPWIKYESMVYWYENLIDDPAFDLHQYIVQTGLKAFGPDVNDNFLAIGHELTQLLQIQITKNSLENFDLYDHRKLDYLTSQAQDSAPSKSLQKLYLDLLNRNISFKFYNSNDYYCADYNLNRLAALVGVHIFHQEHQRIHSQYIKKLFLHKSKKIDRFLFLCYEKMFSYFCSKIFNPYIKCELYRNFLGDRNVKIGEYASQLLDSPELTPGIIKQLDLTQIFLLSRMVGEFLGEIFYKKISLSQSHSQIQTHKISEVFFKIDYDLENFTALKNQLLPNSIYKMQHKRRF